MSAVGALAMAPSDHDEIWTDTGEPWLIRPYYTRGDGVYESTDAGRSWQHMGLEQTGHTARIIVDPHDANVAFVCAVGQAFRPQHERGIFRTSDAGKTWQQVLYVNDNTGCSETAMDPGDCESLPNFPTLGQGQTLTPNRASISRRPSRCLKMQSSMGTAIRISQH